MYHVNWTSRVIYNSYSFLHNYCDNDNACSIFEQETLQVDGDILFGLLKKVSPNVYKHLVSTWLLVRFLDFVYCPVFYKYHHYVM